jgi:hypothetical protein
MKVFIILGHQQNVFWSLEAFRSVLEDVECKLRSVNFRRVSGHRRAFLPAFRVIGSADDKPRSTWECLGAPAPILGVLERTQ